MTVINVAIVDDHPVMRKGLRQLLELDDSLKVTYCTGHPGRVRDELKDNQPDVILLDLNMPEMDGIQTLMVIKQANIRSKVIVFTVSNEQTEIQRAIRAGADGYLLKDEEPEFLIDSIKQCVEGEHVVSPGIEGIVREMVFTPVPENVHPTLAKLTERERDVLRLIAQGLSNKEVGEALGMAEGTAKVHAKRILHKLGKKTRLEVALLARQFEGVI